MGSRRNFVFPTFWQAITLLVFLIFLLMLNEALAVWVGIQPQDVVSSPLINAIVNLLGFGFVTRLGFLRTGASFQDVFPLRRVPVLSLAAVFLTVLGLQILGSELDNLLRSLSPAFKNNSLAGLFENSKAEELILFIVILGPIYEEFLFRGLLVFGFSRNYGRIKAICLSALLFGFMHVDPARIIFATLFGMVLAWVVLETGSLWPSLCGHVLNNLLPFLAGLIPVAIPGFNSPGVGRILEQPLWFDLLGIGLVASGILIFMARNRRIFN